MGKGKRLYCHRIRGLRTGTVHLHQDLESQMEYTEVWVYIPIIGMATGSVSYIGRVAADSIGVEPL